MDLGLKDRVALITGGGGGIGRETAVLLAAEGARVVAADLRVEPAQQTVEAVRDAGGEGAALALDVTSEASAAEAVRQAEAWFGHVDVLVNCAGVYRVGDYTDVDSAAWRQCEVLDMAGIDHFSIICQLEDPGSELSRAILRQMGLGGRR